MQSSGSYINYTPIKDPDYIYDFIHDTTEKVYSNISNYEKKIYKLVNYEKEINHRKDKNYCIMLRIMLPNYIKKYMISLHSDYKLIPWIYKFRSIGHGFYIDIIIFERIVYKKTVRSPKRYKRDMWIDKTTGRTCSADYPNAVHRCKKGTVVVDEEGKTVYENISISPRKYRHLSYKDSKNIDIKKENFKKFRQKLDNLFIRALTGIVKHSFGYKKIKYCTKKYGFREERLKQVNNYNSILSRLNIKLMLMQDALPYTGDYDECNKEFNHIFYSVSNTLKNGRIKYHKNYYINLNPIKIQKNEDYIDNLHYFEKIINEKIYKWYDSWAYDILQTYKYSLEFR